MEKRKIGRPSLPKNIVEYCIAAAIQNPDMARKELVAKIEMELRAKKLKPPSKDKMLKLFQMAPEKTDQDNPWSIAKSLQYGLSSEATGDLLDIWSSCLAVGRDFTIRQAKWACYLRSARLIGDDEKLTDFTLYYFSVRYAIRERICQALKIELNTTDIDALLRLEATEISIALRVGVLDKYILGMDIPNILPQSGINGINVEYPDIVWNVLYDLGITYDWDYSLYSLHSPAWMDNRAKVEVNHLYAYWLKYIGKSPRWEEFSEKAKCEIILKLKQSIETSLNTKQNKFLYGNWEPFEVLENVGYPMNDNAFECVSGAIQARNPFDEKNEDNDLKAL